MYYSGSFTTRPLVILIKLCWCSQPFSGLTGGVLLCEQLLSCILHRSRVWSSFVCLSSFVLRICLQFLRKCWPVPIFTLYDLDSFFFDSTIPGCHVLPDRTRIWSPGFNGVSDFESRLLISFCTFCFRFKAFLMLRFVCLVFSCDWYW